MSIPWQWCQQLVAAPLSGLQPCRERRKKKKKIQASLLEVEGVENIREECIETYQPPRGASE